MADKDATHIQQVIDSNKEGLEGQKTQLAEAKKNLDLIIRENTSTAEKAQQIQQQMLIVSDKTPGKMKRAIAKLPFMKKLGVTGASPMESLKVTLSQTYMEMVEGKKRLELALEPIDAYQEKIEEDMDRLTKERRQADTDIKEMSARLTTTHEERLRLSEEIMKFGEDHPEYLTMDERLLALGKEARDLQTRITETYGKKAAAQATLKDLSVFAPTLHAIVQTAKSHLYTTQSVIDTYGPYLQMQIQAAQVVDAFQVSLVRNLEMRSNFNAALPLTAEYARRLTLISQQFAREGFYLPEVSDIVDDINKETEALQGIDSEMLLERNTTRIDSYMALRLPIDATEEQVRSQYAKLTKELPEDSGERKMVEEAYKYLTDVE